MTGGRIFKADAIKDIWLGMHYNRSVEVRGQIKFTQCLKDTEQGRVYIAELHDETGKIHISWTGSHIQSSPGETYVVTGLCRDVRGVYPRLAGCCFVHIEKSAPVYRDTTKQINSKQRGEEWHRNEGSDYRQSASSQRIRKSFTAVDPNSNWGQLRRRVFIRDNYRCVNCGSAKDLTVDHIKQLSIGGDNAMSNLQTLCVSCHEDKDHTIIYDRQFESRDNYGYDAEVSDKIRRINTAIKHKAALDIQYKDHGGVVTLRRIAPSDIHKGLSVEGKTVSFRCVYVSAYCELRRSKRTFRLSRISLV